jgi:hypothetical protein
MQMCWISRSGRRLRNRWRLKRPEYGYWNGKCFLVFATFIHFPPKKHSYVPIFKHSMKHICVLVTGNEWLLERIEVNCHVPMVEASEAVHLVDSKNARVARIYHHPSRRFIIR